MNENKNICPCCPRACDLSSPRCPRGAEYARTGIAPSKGENHERTRGHHEHGDHNGHKGCKHEHKENRFSHYAEMDINDKILAQLSKLSHQSHMVSGGRGGQKRILHILSKEGSMTQRELTQRLDIQPGSASEMIKKLESSGYILRTTNEADRRTADISLTEAGKAQLREDGKESDRAGLFSALSNDEASRLLSLLEKLSADWDSRFKDHRKSHGQSLLQVRQLPSCVCSPARAYIHR